MPPPASKPTDPTDLADALTSAGIDLKEEEARLTASTVDESRGPLNDDEAARIVQRRAAESRTSHLQSPFLEPHILSNRLFRKTRDSQCQSFTLNTGHGQIVTAGPAADIATLLSLACKERLNQFLTRAVFLARARRRAQNVVTGEWADSVKGASPDVKAAVPDSAISPGNPLKRSFSFANDLFPGPPATTTLANETAKALRGLQQREFQKEQERLAKKAKREATSNGGLSGGGSGGGGGGGGGGATPSATAPSTPGPDASPSTPGGGGDDRKMSAKESRKHMASKKEEVMSHKAANATANMMMGVGGFGGKRKKKTYSWMSAVAGGGAASLAPIGVGGGLAAPAAGPGTPGGSIGENGGLPYWSGGQRIGAWRDDGERGGGVQIRDWIGALEGDGRGVGRGIVKAYLKMK
ncbi:hypothetical protein Q9L58_005463 [Maublancomyces gigas]|uniref:Transcription initiation factor TFIID subunit 4 n=1 Tax=Discina gigas TaxID=1032678 RepID=A0ABR3GID3_9PEZI